MGRIANGLMWGVTPDDMDDTVDGLLTQYRRVVGRGVHGHWTNGTPPRLLGVWVAIGENGVGSIPAFSATVEVSKLATAEPYAGYLLAAKGKWDAFQEWCLARGVTFPPAALYVTPVDESDVSIYP